MPQHFLLEKGGADSILDNENTELSSVSGILQRVEYLSDFIVIDTPGHDSYLTRLAHSMADTLITPFERFLCRFRLGRPYRSDDRRLARSVTTLQEWSARHGANAVRLTMACLTGLSSATASRNSGRTIQGGCWTALRAFR